MSPARTSNRATCSTARSISGWCICNSGRSKNGIRHRHFHAGRRRPVSRPSSILHSSARRACVPRTRPPLPSMPARQSNGTNPSARPPISSAAGESRTARQQFQNLLSSAVTPSSPTATPNAARTTPISAPRHSIRRIRTMIGACCWAGRGVCRAAWIMSKPSRSPTRIKLSRSAIRGWASWSWWRRRLTSAFRSARPPVPAARAPAPIGFAGPGRGGKEGIEDMTRKFPYYFVPRLKEFTGQMNKLPFDAHWFIALTAPRPWISVEGTDDQNCVPNAVKQSVLAAQPVYAIPGVPVGPRGRELRSPPPRADARRLDRRVWISPTNICAACRWTAPSTISRRTPPPPARQMKFLEKPGAWRKMRQLGTAQRFGQTIQMPSLVLPSLPANPFAGREPERGAAHFVCLRSSHSNSRLLSPSLSSFHSSGGEGDRRICLSRLWRFREPFRLLEPSGKADEFLSGLNETPDNRSLCLRGVGPGQLRLGFLRAARCPPVWRGGRRQGQGHRRLSKRARCLRRRGRRSCCARRRLSDRQPRNQIAHHPSLRTRRAAARQPGFG